MTETNNIERLFLPSGCLSETGLMGFVKQKLTDAEMEQANGHFLKCDLCRLALRGFELNPNVVETNRILHQQIDLMINKKSSEPIHTIQPKTKAVSKRLLFYIKAFRNIAALVPLALMLCSGLLLAAAFIIYHQISGIHNPTCDTAMQQEIPIEIKELEKQAQKLSPPMPKIAKFEVVHEEIMLDDEIIIEAEEEFVIDHRFTLPLVEEEAMQEEEIFLVVEEFPRFPGGPDALSGFLTNNLRYPQTAREQSIGGTVYLSFIINTDGSIDSIKVLQGVHWSLDEEALRVIRAMPVWIPGKQRGKPVKVQITMPFRFRME